MFQSPVWPAHTVRALHSSAQLSFLWRLSLSNADLGVEEDLAFLVSRVTIPGVEIERSTYRVGGQEFYFLERMRRGGPIVMSFIEIEGGYVEDFFRDWLNEVDEVVPGSGSEARFRTPKGLGPGDGYVRTGRLTLFRRTGGSSMEWTLRSMMPVRVGPREFVYGGSSEVQVPVELVCDEVKRTA